MPVAGVSINDIVTRSLELLREVPGVSVQTYGEPRLQKLAQTVFELVFSEHFWPDLCQWQTVALDGTTGKPTTNLTVRTFGDIQRVYRQDYTKPLPIFQHTTNPDVITGTTARFIDPLKQPEAGAATKIFRVLPITSVGSVTFRARYSPGDLTANPDSAAIHLDKEMLAFGCVYMSLEQDQSNPGATQMYQGLFESRKDTLRASYADLGVSFNDEIESIPTDWYTP